MLFEMTWRRNVFDDMEEEEARRYDLPKKRKKRDLVFGRFSDNDLEAHEHSIHIEHLSRVSQTSFPRGSTWWTPG